MNKNYIAPSVEVANIGTQSIICASGGSAGAYTPIGVLDQTTDKQW